MKKQKTIQTRRAKPKAGFRMLNAATRFTKNRKQRAATTADHDDMTEVPGVGVARALLVILLLHVAAIAGICLHNRWSESSDLEATIPALEKNAPITRIPELRGHAVSSGDTYQSIASHFGVDIEALKRVNEEKELLPGMIANIPNRRAAEVRPVEQPIVQTQMSPPVRQAGYGQHTSRPLIQTSDTQSHPGSQPGEMALVEGSAPEPTQSAVLITPRPPRADPPIRVQPPRESRAEPAPVATRGRRHTVRSGETLWRIAQNNGISVDALKRANPNVNVSALKIGATLMIPSR